jgi:hypothetical protein
MMTPRRIIVASTATAIFVLMMSIAELQVRSSPKWPPPAKHELGGWQIEDPVIWDWSVGINIPASVPILWAWQTTDRFTYALDDHQLVVYVPWIPLVFLLWYVVGCHLERTPGWRFYVALGAQAAITLELLYIGTAYYTSTAVPLHIATCFWTWIVASLVGWGNIFSKKFTL